MTGFVVGVHGLFVFFLLLDEDIDLGLCHLPR